MFGSSNGQILTKVMAQPSHVFSYQHATVAEIEGEPRGFCQGFPHGTPSGELALAKAAGIRSLRAAAVAAAVLPVVVALSKHSPQEWYLQAIAVTARSRSSGVGSALFTDAFTRARDSGCTSLVLDVDAANVRARELYERLGLVVTSTSRRAILADNLRVERMEARL